MSNKNFFKSLYKKIIIFIFKLIYNIPTKSSNLYSKIYFFFYLKKKIKYNFYKISDVRIYNDGMHNVTYIKKNNIIRKISLQLLNGGIFQKNYKNEVFKFGTTKLKTKINGPILSVIQDISANNYFHFLFDVAAKIIISSKKYNLNSFRYILLPTIKYSFQKDIIKALGLDIKKIIDAGKLRHIETDTAIVPQHPYFFEGFIWDAYKKLPKWLVLLLINKFLNLKKRTKKINKIFIDRTDTSHLHNQIDNQTVVDSFLKKYQFTKIKLSKYTFFEQIYLFNNSKYIIGAHGAGMANLIFCKKNTIVIELKANTFSKNYLYKRISKICDLKYSSYISLKKYGQKINVDIDKIKKLLKNK